MFNPVFSTRNGARDESSRRLPSSASYYSAPTGARANWWWGKENRPYDVTLMDGVSTLARFLGSIFKQFIDADLQLRINYKLSYR